MPKDAQKYNWKETNLSMFGSDAEKKVKGESAESEPAWQGSGQKCGLQIWRINKFKVEKWPVEDYGKFYSGDSYIILYTWKEEGGEELQYDIHFWIGKYSSQDEYGTAAYKTVELDTFHNDKPIQHREVQGYESLRFKAYFDFYTVMKGGCDSGFRRVGPQAYKPRLYQVVGEKKQIAINEIPMKRGKLNSEDVFILDMGLRIFQFNGEDATKDEKFKATQYVQTLRSERQGRPRLDILEERSISPGHRFYKAIPPGEIKGKAEEKLEVEKGMFKLSEDCGNLKFTPVLSGSINRDYLDSGDVFVVISSNACFCWIGRKASIDERKNALTYTHKYLQTECKNPYLPVTVLMEGQKSKDFDAAFEEED